jgi:hypothetical protein
MDVEQFLTLVSFDSKKKLRELGAKVGMKSDTYCVSGSIPITANK